MELRIDGKKTVLCSAARVLKSEKLIKGSKSSLGVDTFLSKAGEGLLAVYRHFETAKLSADDCFILSTPDKKHCFFFKLGRQTDRKDLGSGDIVFYKYITSLKRRKAAYVFGAYLSASTINLTVEKSRDRTDREDFAKLYSVYSTDNANFPFLNEEQKGIVTLEDKNVLVHGVAGSGKTNICIDKIIYCACREYAGRTLYTTYSAGLLTDTKYKIALFKDNVKKFAADLREGNVIFADGNVKTSIENRLGIWLDVDGVDAIGRKLNTITDHLENKVDYFLISDLYRKNTGAQPPIADESVFIREYIGNIKNYRLGANLERIKNLSYEIVYKEIYGMIFGCCAEDGGDGIMTKSEYIERRRNSFTREECEVIYAIAQDHARFLAARGYCDNNSMSREMLASYSGVKYSLAVVDEVQDLTQVTLKLLRKISTKMFCVGDALQMINPSYFSFAYLKRLMYDKEIASVAELKHNYRNSALIERLLGRLGEMNTEYFGTHSFVLKSSGADDRMQTAAVKVNESDFIRDLSGGNFDSLTVIVDTVKKKEEMRKVFPKLEILTVSEIKGLERNAVVLIDILSDNERKWAEMARRSVDRKTADENSVYRYYFNLLYVALSRAVQYVYVYERSDIKQFESFFGREFENLSSKQAIRRLADTVGTVGIAEDETLGRIDEFIKLGQFDNALFAASKLEDADERELQSRRIAVFRDHSAKGDYRQAGVMFWKLGLIEDAKRQFKLSGDEKFIDLIDACEGVGTDKLDYEIISFYPDAAENSAAAELIVDALEDDLKGIREEQKQLKETIRRIYNGQ